MACDSHGGIGKNNQLPWSSLDGDLQRFKNLTQGSTVVMGFKTWESLPKKPLPNRRNIVFSRSVKFLNGAEVVNSTSAIENLNNAWFIGGAELLHYMWTYIDEFHLTKANTQFNCDTHINLLFLEENFNRKHYQQFSDNSYEIWVKK